MSGPFPSARVLVLAMWLGWGAAQASPATDLYRAAVDAVRRDYFGWSTADFTALDDKYATLLSVKCAPAGESCDYDTGRKVLTDLLREFGDAHTNVRDPEGALRLKEISADMAVQRTGARVVRVEGGLLVASVMPGSPAEQVGLKPFDLLPTVEGQAAGKRGGENAVIGPNDFIRLERLGRPFTVTRLERDGTQPPLTLTTALLKARDVPTLSWAGQDGKVAVISYPTFLSRDASELFLERVQEAQRAGARQLVVDLRFNGGGSLVECVAAASTFAPVQYKTRYRLGSYVFTGLDGQEGRPASRLNPRDAGHHVWDGPVAVLVGPDTASCAEVFTFFAQQAGALAVGTRTKGVGNSGVNFETLPDGGVVAVTVLKAFTADDRPLPAYITPDIDAPTDITLLTRLGRDTTLDAALRALETKAGKASP